MEYDIIPEAPKHTPDISIRGIIILAKGSILVAAALLLLPASWLRANGDRDTRSFPPNQVRAASSVPPNGDRNPYGVAFVPPQFPAGGKVNPGDILVSNFNNSQNPLGTGNLRGTGATIVSIPHNQAPSVFFQGKTGLGLTTALNILQKGFVLVGSFPSSNGSCANAQAGSILIINSSGRQVGAITNSIDGPWDSALFDEGSTAKFFVANALNGTIVRFNLEVGGPGGVSVRHATQIASGYTHLCDPETFVDAPTALFYDPQQDVLYVASTADNAVFAIAGAGSRNHDGGMGKVIHTDKVRLHRPLRMVQAPSGHPIVGDNDSINPDPIQPSEVVEVSGETAQFAAVDDNVNVL